KIGKTGKAIKSNITDNESAKMPSSHGVIQGYNGIATADDKHQVVVSAKALGSGSEHDQLKPIIELSLEHLESIAKPDTAKRRL
ncbi:Mobile element protein, partial [hydrothermal vent metagenome]